MKHHVHSLLLRSGILAAFFLLLRIPSSAQAVVEIGPEVSTVAPGSSVSVTIAIRNVTDLHMASVVVSFDPSIIQFGSSSSGSFLKSNAQGYSVFYYQKLMPSDTPDTVRVDQAILGAAAVNGTGDLFTITFKALREGTSPIRIEKIELRNSPNYIIPSSGAGGTVVVGNSSNKSPMITSTPAETGVVGQPYAYQIQAQDPDGDTLNYRILEGPAFLGISATTGALSGTPNRSGSYAVTVRASDGRGGTATQTFSLRVFKTDHPPSAPVQLSPENGGIVRTLSETLSWTASIDPRPGDGIQYMVHLTSARIDTTFDGITDTRLLLDSRILENSRLYSWTVKATDGIDTVVSQQAFTFTTSTTTSADGTGAADPRSMSLEQNYPNPFTPSTTIAFTLQHDCHMRLSVTNALGAEVAVLVDGRMTAGRHSVPFRAADLPSGVYTCVLQSGSAVATRLMTLVR